MSAFHEVRLPLAVSIGASGGPERVTEVLRLASGMESRNVRWAGSRRRWDVGGATIRSHAAEELIAFFEARSGRLHGFRFRDPVDSRSCTSGAEISPEDQPLGVGDGATRSFQLIKRYESGGEGWDRMIRKPVVATVVVAIDGVPTEDFEVDVTTGVLTFDAAPFAGTVLTAGYAFDVPVRFDADRIEMAVAGHGAMRVLRAPLVEIVG